VRFGRDDNFVWGLAVTAGPSATLRFGRDDSFLVDYEDSRLAAVAGKGLTRPMEEGALIEEARMGNQEAFARLHALHVGYIRGVVRSIMRNDDVEDLCQDTFLLAFTRLDSFQGGSAFRTWLTRIAVNQCMISLRNNKSRIQADDSERFACHDAHLEASAARMDVHTLLERLRPAYRQVLEMAYFDGMSDQEIADALNTSLFSVKGKIYHAKRRIRKATKNK
jgi:RNA polymerase sigma-70 factor (ECF subfamily)